MSRPYSKGDRRQDQRRGGGNQNNFNKGGSRGDRSIGDRGFNRGGWQDAKNRGRNDHKRNEPSNQSNNSSIDLMKTLLKLVVNKSVAQIFNKETGMLVLSRMRDAEDLVSVSKSVDFNSVSFCKALCEVLREELESNIRILQLDDNNISKFSVFLDALIGSGLHEGITAISAQNNRISDIQFIDVLKKFTNLNEVLLLGNSITKEKSYASLPRNLPGLAILDGEPVARNLLALRYPAEVLLTPEADGVINVLKVNLLGSIMFKNFDVLPNLYNSQAAFSCSSTLKNGFFLSQIPVKQLLNTNDLPVELLRSMKGDFCALNQALRWRNLFREPESFRHTTRGKNDVVAKLKDFCGVKFPFFVHFDIASSNVEFLRDTQEPWMNVSVAIVTIHGTMRYYWNPKKNDADVSLCPFISFFFDRTFSLTLCPDQVSLSVCNDMIHVRPDYVVSHRNGRPADSVFSAFAPDRLERLRRRLFPEGSLEIMAALIQGMANHGIPLSDYNLGELIARLKASTLEEMSLALGSPEGLSSFISKLTVTQV